MAYFVYLNKVLFPVTPGELSMKINNKNKTYTMINDGEINIPKKAGLTEIEFSALLPNVKYPFARYKNGAFHSAKWFLKRFERMKVRRKKVPFIVCRATPGGKILFATDIICTLEEYTIKENADEQGMDLIIDFKLKQYRNYGTKTVKIKKKKKNGKTKKKTVVQNQRDTNKDTSTQQTYTVVKGDCLWAISRRFYGQANWDTVNRIFNANRDKISDPNLIYPGQVLTIPAL